MVTTRSKRVLSEISPNTTTEPSPRKKKRTVPNNGGKENASSHQPKSQNNKPQTNKTAKVDRNAHPQTFICLCENGVKHKCRVSQKCMCMRYADANPGHPFCVTKKGEDLYRAWRVEQVKRDAEAFGVIAYSDHSGYGTAEVVGNILHAFNGVINTEEMDVWMIWAHIEGMARFLSQDNWKFYHIDDAEANRKRVMLIGTAILTTIDHLVDAELFGPNSAIRNVGFIIGLFFEFVVAYEETCESIEDGWRFVVVRKLDEFDIKIRGLKGAERIAEGLREIALEEEAMDQAEKEEQQEAEKDSHDPNPQNDKTDIPPSTPFPNFVNAYKPDIAADSEFRSWDAWDWEQEVRIYTVWHGIDGKIEGNQYDLTLAENYESDDESMSSDDASDVSAR